MKNYVLVLCLLICTDFLFSQKALETVTKVYQGSGYTYNIDITNYLRVKVYNVNNKWRSIDQQHQDGQYINIDAPRTAFVEDDDWTKLKAFGIVHDAFTAEQRKQVAGKKLGIIMYVNNQTGKVDEVDFDFMSDGPYMSIPIPVFRQIETELKKNIWFKPTAKGKTLNYIFHGWRQDPNVTGK